MIHWLIGNSKIDLNDRDGEASRDGGAVHNFSQDLDYCIIKCLNIYTIIDPIDQDGKASRDGGAVFYWFQPRPRLLYNQLPD